MAERVFLYLLGQARAVRQRLESGEQTPLRVQAWHLHLLAYLALNWRRPHRREELQACFWPDASPAAAANNLRQALWHLRHALAPDTLLIERDLVQWNPAAAPWVDALAFEAALDASAPSPSSELGLSVTKRQASSTSPETVLEAAIDLYGGPLLPACYDEWAQLERERLQLRYLAALETRCRCRYEARQWEGALADAAALLAADSFNETAARLAMACHWALGQREAARRVYDALRSRLRSELQTEPLAETTTLHQRILRGEAYPQPSGSDLDAAALARATRLALLETLGAFHQGLEQATSWAAQATGAALAEALRWQGCFRLRLGRMIEARTALAAALPLASSSDQQAMILADLATAETGLGDYAAAGAHYDRALRAGPIHPAARVRLLSSLGGLLGRQGRVAEARRTLAEAVGLARTLTDPAPLAAASGNLAILLIGQRETAAAEEFLQEALTAARRADAHWLTAHLTGHLGVLAQDSGDLAATSRHYQNARGLAEAIGDRRGALLWTLNLGIVCYEQGRCAEALPLLIEGRDAAASQGSKSLEAGARIFLGACQVRQGAGADGLASIEAGLALAQSVGDTERILMGYLHHGRALAAAGRREQAVAALQSGLRLAETSGMERLSAYLQAELGEVRPTSPVSLLTPP